MQMPTDAPAIEWGGRPTVQTVLRIAAAFLAEAGIEDPAVDARRLTAHALGLDRTGLLREANTSVDATSLARLSANLHRRTAREPVSRIIGQRDFHGLSLELNEATLDPRPDTETVVAVACHLAARMPLADGGTLRILDLGTGTGAIALALLAALPSAEAVATDISSAALDMARRNAERLGLAERVRFVRAHWLDDVDGTYHLIVSNPPYIPTDDIAGLTAEVAEWDPRAALDGGPDGLDAYRAILAKAGQVLAPGGWIVFEVGHDQSLQVASLALEKGFEPAPLDWQMLRDLGGNVRCVAVATPHCDNKKTLGIDDRSV
jgi:release factor glutamine methyltransferase